MTVRPVGRISIITEESVYGTILVSGMIVATGGHGASSWSVFLSVIGTVIVFWVAHVYAGTIAGHGAFGGDDTSLATAFRRSLRRSVGFLTSALPPSVILLFGALDVVNDTLAIWLALWAGVLILAILGYTVFAVRGRSWVICILGSLTTAAFGVAMIALKAVIH